VLIAGCSTPTAALQSIHGVLVAVDSSSIQRVNSFTLRGDDGRELTFSVAPDFNQSAASGPPMTPGHMRQHMALAEPVTVSYREEGGRLVALSATD
jgi:hypothetical protein